jgi:hypothetical protein
MPGVGELALLLGARDELGAVLPLGLVLAGIQV